MFVEWIIFGMQQETLPFAGVLLYDIRFVSQGETDSEMDLSTIIIYLQKCQRKAFKAMASFPSGISKLFRNLERYMKQI